ncbi:ankyrin repeat domain-containing protein [Sulfurovum sp. CS9]|uniref:ankyrin repeat domain-containing protein n=1 Tax=Sulfurovum sp. CS9 TaxID=3391146 RepID=UPI0039ECB665
MKYEGMKEMNINKITKFALLLVCSLLFFDTASCAMPAAPTSLEADLLATAKTGDLAKVKNLLASGVDVNAKDKNGWTPLLMALGHGLQVPLVPINVNIIKTLIQAGADLNWETPRGQTPLNMAVHREDLEVVKVLIAAGAKVNQKIKSKSAPDYYQGATPIFMAVESKNLEVIKELIRAGANVNERNNMGVTPLMVAMGSRNIGPLLVLIAEGADINVKTTVDSGDARAPAGTTALMGAAHEGNLKVVEVLLIAGADIAATNSEGYTALMYAKKQNNEEIVEILKEPEQSKGVARRALGKELIDAVGYKKKTEYAKLLIRLGVDVNVKDKDGSTALIEAIKNDSEENVRALVKAGADINAPDGEIGATPLIWAAFRNGNKDIIKILLQSGAEVNRKARGDSKGHDGAGWTALMTAAMAGYTDVVSQLLKAGANPNSVNKAGKTAMDIAKEEGHKEIVRLLEKAVKSEIVKEIQKNPSTSEDVDIFDEPWEL